MRRSAWCSTQSSNPNNFNKNDSNNHNNFTPLTFGQIRVRVICLHKVLGFSGTYLSCSITLALIIALLSILMMGCLPANYLDKFIYLCLQVLAGYCFIITVALKL